MNAVDQALATFEPISLEGANDIAELQTRIDRKYLIDEATLWELLDQMLPTARVLEIDGEFGCDYSSTYFDTDDLALYRAAVQGRRVRFKVRSRTYGDTGPCFLEVKAKGGRGANVKSRIRCRRDERDEITVAGLGFVANAVGDAGLAGALRPVLRTEYSRTTVIDPIRGTRLTFDRQLHCTDVGGASAVLDGIVVETKSTGAPSLADQWLWQHRVRPTKISKFGTGLAAIRPELPSNKWRRVIDRHWRTEAAPPTSASVPSRRRELAVR